jgi:hypothetical protein
LIGQRSGYYSPGWPFALCKSFYYRHCVTSLRIFSFGDFVWTESWGYFWMRFVSSRTMRTVHVIDSQMWAVNEMFRFLLCPCTWYMRLVSTIMFVFMDTFRF